MAPVTARNRLPRANKSGKTGLLIINALTKLKHRTGWTARTITKFIQSEYGGAGVDGKRVSQALRRGVNLGLLKVHARKYRLKSIAEKSFGEPTDRRRSRRRSGRSRSRSGSRKRRRRRKSEDGGGRRRRRRRR